MMGNVHFLKADVEGTEATPRILKVFVVEDDPSGQLKLEDLLRSSGHDVVARADAADSAFSSLARLRDIGIVPDVAVIGAEWKDPAAHRVVLALRARGIPVVVGALGEETGTRPPHWTDQFIGNLFGRDGIRDALAAISRFVPTRSRPIDVI
jgi:hypothetical protein